MSVMLSACRKKEAPKKKKKKTKQAHHEEQHSPFTKSGENKDFKTWNWALDGCECSLTLNKHSKELWCNNYIMKTEISFGEDHDGIDMDFDIFGHKCCIKMITQGKQVTSPMTYDLTVDKARIDERVCFH